MGRVPPNDYNNGRNKQINSKADDGFNIRYESSDSETMAACFFVFRNLWQVFVFECDLFVWYFSLEQNLTYAA